MDGEEIIRLHTRSLVHNMGVPHITDFDPRLKE